ncbi:MAG TPA: hypothetical protein VGI69_04620 [Gaiellaceae bacterium]
MPTGLRHVAGVATAVFCIALALPAGALAGHGAKCNASACKVYSEPSGPNPGGAQGPQGTGSGPSGSSESPPPSNVARVLAGAGADKQPLSRLVAGAGLGNPESGAASVAAPSAFAAILDLGPGPAVLLGILLATAVGLLLHRRLRGSRRARTTA